MLKLADDVLRPTASCCHNRQAVRGGLDKRQAIRFRQRRIYKNALGPSGKRIKRLNLRPSVIFRIGYRAIKIVTVDGFYQFGEHLPLFRLPFIQPVSQPCQYDEVASSSQRFRGAECLDQHSEILFVNRTRDSEHHRFGRIAQEGCNQAFCQARFLSLRRSSNPRHQSLDTADIGRWVGHQLPLAFIAR